MLQYLCSSVTAEDSSDMNRNNKVNKEQHLKAARNQEDQTTEENAEGFYVDSFRNISVSLGSKDLRWGKYLVTSWSS